ncbi:MAG: flagellar motor switch protein FliG [Desulfobulbus propionicus]|nr:MAG: flagellar motor switch protein FliG [Desulfobulbus propionicus]
MAGSDKQLTGVARAATLLMCLGEEAASEIMKELSDEEIFRVSRYMVTVEHIPENVQQRVLEDFELALETQAGLVVHGQDFAKKTIAKTGDEARVALLMRQLITGTEGKPLETISKMQPQMVAGLLEPEHPQTVALVLSTQTPEHASAIIAHLPENNRSDVIYRIANLDPVSPKVINQIEEVLNKEIGVVISDQDQRQVGGIQKVVDILDNMTDNLDSDILETLEETDPDMVESIRKLMFTFEDLANMDGRSMQMILREVNNDSLTMALKTASDEIKELIFSNMSARAADMIKDDLEALGPVRLSEVEAMQQSIVKIAMKLEEEGKLILGRGGGDELV